MPKFVTRKCENKTCGCEFQARAADVARGWGKFCSKHCKAVVQERRTGQNAAYRHRQQRRMDGDPEGRGWGAHEMWRS